MSKLFKCAKAKTTLLKKVVSSIMALVFITGSQITVSQSVSDYSVIPPTVVDSTTPLVMLAMSRDNQLWHKAYNDYSDLDGDGILDTTYNDNFEYYGYFHSNLCYSYSQANRRFAPTTNVSPGTHQCSGTWSGNFLNWLTTTRIDVVRKVLYGGYRDVDTGSATILQRAFIPSDNHAFVKVVDDANIIGSISDYTPITGESVLSFCNVTDYTGVGSDISANMDPTIHPPLLKVAIGNQFTWSGSERNQCQYQDEPGSNNNFSAARPPSASVPGIPSNSELVVRVEVCVAGLDRSDSDVCQQYIASDSTLTYKPYGLLQTYGQSGTYKFGLMTGSYVRNTDGGVLRKNVVFMGGDDAASDDREINPETGVFINQTTSDEGIINTLNRLRIQGWDYGSTLYDDCDSPGIAEITFLTSGSSNRQCRDWGNPISEIYLEALRYFAGASPTPDFVADDSGIISGLGTVAWDDPYTADTACSNCSIIVLSTGLNNFDGDQLASAASLPGLSGASDLEAQTDTVGAAEGLNIGTYLIGRGSSGGTADECDGKSLTNFSDASGPCPEVPTLNGTFNIAGAAYYAHQNDLRPLLEGTQNVSTYSVSLAESLPSFEIDTGSGHSISFVPTCRSNSSGDATPTDSGWRECSLVDLTVAEQTSVYGRLVIAWEDSPWGFDYDMDAYSVIEYCAASGSVASVQSQCPDYTSDHNLIYHESGPGGAYDYNIYETRPNWGSASAGQIQMRVSVIAGAAGFAMKFGYTMNGSTIDDGSYDDEVLRYGGYNFNSDVLTGTDTNRVIWSQNARRFTAGTGTPGMLENPLWYAAKYGGFNDRDNDNFPNHVNEWDNFDISGGAGSDGIPDSYFPVSNPANLPEALDNVFADINTRVSSGSAAAVNAQTGSGEGAIYQALYAPRTEDASGNSISWTGTLNALFMDAQGRIREDRNGNGILESTDRVLTFFFDEVAEETFIQAFLVDVDGSTGAADGSPFRLSSSDYNPIWSAQEQLRSLVSYTANRTNYTDTADTGRFIFTAFDRDEDGQVISPDYATINSGSGATQDAAHAFVASNFSLTGATENDHRYLGFGTSVSATQVENLINYIRGEESIVGARSRTLNGEQFLLGDIVHSTPEVVGKPSARYDLLYNDDSYREFLDYYSDRRNVVYVGANDGMLHAFNAGFFNNSTIAFEANSSHPLGSEIWAYVPFNLLPHLQWLPSPTYPHVYYVDGPVQSFDVNIFPDDATHPNGWGTIIVANMRFGGGDYSLDHDNDSLTPDITTRSAYVIMDVTDPEQPPELIAEITHEDLGFTTSQPTVIKYRAPTSSGSFVGTTSNAWYLAFGSGPAGIDANGRRNALDDAVSEKSAKVFLFDLVNRTLTSTELLDSTSTPEADSFTGGLQAVDWDLDYQDDAVYFGLVGGTPSVPSGKLKRGQVGFAGNVITVDYSRDLYNDRSLAFSAPPFTYRDRNNDYWVYAGTGRFYVADDNMSDQQQYYFGIKEPEVGGTAPLNITVDDIDLVDTTDVEVFQDGRVREGVSSSTANLSAGGVSANVEDFDDILEFVSENGGWKFQFRDPTNRFSLAANAHDRIRNNTRASLAGTSLVITAYNATGEFCDSEGEGFLYTPHVAAGVPAPFAPVGTDSSRTLTALNPPDPDPESVLMGVTLGIGIPSDPIVTRPSNSTVGGPNNCDEYKVIVQTSSARIGEQTLGCEALPAGRRSWREIPVNW